jgi:hypothetical protein
MSKRAQYTAIGYVVSKVVIPLAKRQAKQQARTKVRGVAAGTRNAAVSHPGRTSLAIGAAIGAIGWLLTRRGGASASDLED